MPPALSAIEALHQIHFQQRRVRVLQGHLAGLFPRGARVLDVGCGDGSLAFGIAAGRPDLRVEGIDVLMRAQTCIPVSSFDGRTIPFPAGTFDAVAFVDVLHHAEDPVGLIAEGLRVSRESLVIKDHLCEGALAGATLRFMDRVGNARYGVPLPYSYWTREQWHRTFAGLGISVRSWNERLGLYPWFLRPLFERSLHFLALVERARQRPVPK